MATRKTPVYTDIISADNLAALASQCTILDCRAKLGDPDWGKKSYDINHIAGSVHADLDQDLAAPPGLHGRHPLPDRDAWLACVQRWGITPERQVVTYDDAGGPYAARAWWMLRWLGHTAVAVLDGGLQTWRGDLQSGPAPPTNASVYPHAQSLTHTISTAGLQQAIDAGNAPMLIDARSKSRWAGEEEPIDPVAGHIPGALCYPFQENLDAQGCFKPATELRSRFAAGDTGDTGDNQIISYCGSGVTAAHNILAMHIAGLPEPMLYADSWSGWITDPARPIETAT